MKVSQVIIGYCRKCRQDQEMIPRTKTGWDCKVCGMRNAKKWRDYSKPKVQSVRIMKG